MGKYVNPVGMSKDQWLIHNGVICLNAQHAQEMSRNDPSCLPVVALDNGVFVAIAVIYSPQEFAEFKEPDGRYKTWYVVPKEILIQVGAITAEKAATYGV